MSEDRDPNGLGAHIPGAKLDCGKNRLGLVLGGFARALQDVGRVGTYGASKYTPDGWKCVKNGRDRYWDAFWRHLFAYAGGETIDPESGLHHLSHAAWNLLAYIELGVRPNNPAPANSVVNTKQVSLCKKVWMYLLGKLLPIWRWSI
jgi:hypothetical protein